MDVDSSGVCFTGVSSTAIGVGDINGDGLADILLAERSVNTSSRATSGIVYVFYGTRASKSGTVNPPAAPATPSTELPLATRLEIVPPSPGTLIKTDLQTSPWVSQNSVYLE